MSFFYFYLIILLNPILGQWWKIFPKMDRPSWEAFIPIYNYYQVFKFTCKKPFWAFLFVFPGVHLVMLMVANVSLLRRFGFFSFSNTLQGIFFPYLLMNKASKKSMPILAETNWNNSKELETRKWGDHIVLFMCLPVIGHGLVWLFSLVKKSKPGEKPQIKEWGDSLLFALIAASIIRTYVFEPFQIPTGSMEKTMLVGDFLFVNKLVYGPKVPITPLTYPLVHNNIPWVNVPSYTDLEKGKYTRLWGYSPIQAYDIVVFNYPSGDTAVYDPRVPDGLMGHDYHGIVNDEALNQFKLSLNLMQESYSGEDFPKFQEFIDNISIWKNKARESLKSGNFPVGHPDWRVAMHKGLIYRPVDKRENYIKRCIGIPGDVLEIRNAVVYRNGKPAQVFENQTLVYKVSKQSVTFPDADQMQKDFGLENTPDGQTRLDFDNKPDTYYLLNLTANEKNRIQKAYPTAKFETYIESMPYRLDGRKPSTVNYIENLRTFPKDFYINNTMTNFEEFTVPKKGSTVDINSKNIAWYRRIITAYEGHKLEEKRDGSIFIDGRKVTKYTFGMNYYWMMGDNRYFSADSRVWGFVPEDHIVGRASLVWFSNSPYKGVRWERIFKFVN